MSEDLPKTLGLSAHPDETVALPDDDATRALGKRLGLVLGPGDFVGLVGNLGAGKTTLMQGLVEALSPEAEASSPTYTLVNEYATSPRLFHFDLYRLEHADDLEGIAYWEYVEDVDAIACVEWLDRIPSAWPGAGVLVVLSHEADGTRRAALWLGKRTDAWREDDVPA